MRWIRPRSLPQLVQRCSGHRGQRTSPPCWKLPSLLLHLPHERLYQYTTRPAGMWQWHPNVTTCLIIIIIIIIIGAALMPRPNMPRCGSKYLSIFRSGTDLILLLILLAQPSSEKPKSPTFKFSFQFGATLSRWRYWFIKDIHCYSLL